MHDKRSLAPRAAVSVLVMAWLLCLADITRSQDTAQQQTLSSPDGRLAITFRTIPRAERRPSRRPNTQVDPADSAGGRLVYEVSFQGKLLIEPSALQLELHGSGPLGVNVRLVEATTSSTDETYSLVTGKTSLVRNHYNALRLELEETAPPGRRLIMEARAYDDAVAFRYLVPEQEGLDEFRLAGENTEFRLSKDPFIYALILPHYRSMYESEYVPLSASSLSNQGGVASTVLIGLPLLMEVPGVAWLAIAEANLRDYAAMYLVNPSGGWTSHKFESRLSPRLDDPETAVVGALPHHSAWRVLLVGDEPGRLIESNVITSLNPESAVEDVSWIQAGRAAWDWWSGSLTADGASAYTTENMKYYVDFAAQSGLEYMLVDAGWSARNDITGMNGRVDIPALIRYAEPQGVKIWIWIGYRETNRQMDEAFPLYQKWGVAGVKVDFVERDDQEGIEFYYRVAAKAAQHHLLVDFHGSTKPTGLERTYPNVFGYEAILGMEQSKAGSRDNPEHHVMLPFTRMLAGRMDYTPGGFDNVTKDQFEARMQNPQVMGTRAHQLAMYVVYESPFQMVSDHPSAYEGQPAFAFIRDVPATWDETRVLSGAPGEFILMARRRGDEWFLGGMTDWSPRRLDIPLDFLGAGRYLADIYADAPDADRQPQHVAIETRSVDRGGRLTAQLAPAGGYAVRLRPEADTAGGGRP
ncbi:MAG: glycoside hydrolase family 97 protein [Sedimentisphaerales bacterium]|nr:glycoside hydrolase family 97 protein [Sedimentisphaerales bacterium]